MTYDTVGIITDLKTNGVSQPTTTSTSTNRLTGLGAAYDAGGNLTAIQIGGQQQAFEYDALNLMRSMTTSSDIARTFVYDAFDERLATLECVPTDNCVSNPARDVWTMRGLDGKVLRTYEHLWEDDVWRWQRDYVYRDGVPMASVEPDGIGGAETTLHLHTDHLGSIREITDSAGSRVAYHSYYPFGGEAVSTGSDEVTLKFTGHERDESGGISLDYMHARYCSPGVGRLLSVDPARSYEPSAPGTWNRYSYVTNSPIRYVDPDGEARWDGVKLLWNRAKHVWNNHVRGTAPPHKSRYNTTDMERVKKLSEKTVRRPDKVDVQAHDGRTVWQREFRKEIGADGERVNVVVTERVAENTEKIVTSFPAKAFKEILSLIPVVGAYFLAEDAAMAGAEALEHRVENSEIAARQRYMEALVEDPEF